MVRVDGFRLGNRARLAFDQSINALESRFAQKARSSLSDLNLGILVFMGLVASLFLAAHVSRGNDSQRRAANSKGHKEQSRGVRLAQCVIADFPLRIFVVIRDEQRRVKENLLALGPSDAMFAIILLLIAIIPLKLRATKEDFIGIAHTECIR